jgi:exonuclease SbcD
MDIFHASDLHYSPTNLVEADRCFGFAVEDAIARRVQAAVISGDSTDHRLEAHSPAFLQLARRIKQLADHCPVFMLQGTFSHEPEGMLHILGMIGAKHPIVISDRVGMYGLRDNQWFAIDESNAGLVYELAITSLPTLNKAELALQVGAANAGEAMGEHLAAIMSSFAPVNAGLRARGVPTILVSHGTLDGSLTETGVPMAGLDHEFTAGSLYAAGTNAVLLGHLHKHQVWERRYEGLHQVIAYAGSVGRFHYGEIGEKYYLHWRVQANSVSFDAVQTPSKRMIDLAFDGVPDIDEIARVANQCAGAFVRVNYYVDQEYASTIDHKAIAEALGGAAEVKIERTVLTIQRQRCAGISRLGSIEAKLKAWCDHTETPSARLLDRLAALQNADPSDIANDFSVWNRQQGGAEPMPHPPAEPSRVQSMIQRLMDLPQEQQQLAELF